MASVSILREQSGNKNLWLCDTEPLGGSTTRTSPVFKCKFIFNPYPMRNMHVTLDRDFGTPCSLNAWIDVMGLS